MACLALAAGVVAAGPLQGSKIHLFMGISLVWALLAQGGTDRPLLWGALLRGVLLLAPLSLTDDPFRYVWEGKVLRAGLSPFEYAPEHPLLSPLRDELWAKVAHKGVATIYPPGALALFALFREPLHWRIASAAADLGVVALLARVGGRRGFPEAAGVWALHPLCVVESAGGGHLEPLAMLPLLWALDLWDRGRPALAGIFAGVAGLVKVLPFALLLRRKALPGLFLAGAVGAAALAWVGFDLQGSRTFAQSWAFNSLAGRLLGEHVRLVGVPLGALVTLFALRKPDPVQTWLWIAGALVLLSPVVHPWYVLWVFAPALILGVRPWGWLAATAPLSYAALASYDAGTSRWTEPEWPVWIEFLPLIVGLGWWEIRRRRSLGSPPGASPSPSPT